MSVVRQGFQVTFYTVQERRQAGMALCEWLLLEGRKLGIAGGTVIAGSEGFGHGGRLHAAHFFELGDQPVAVTMAMTAADCDRLFRRLREVGVRVFYVKTPIEFGSTGD